MAIVRKRPSNLNLKQKQPVWCSFKNCNYKVVHLYNQILNLESNSFGTLTFFGTLKRFTRNLTSRKPRCRTSYCQRSKIQLRVSNKNGHSKGSLVGGERWKICSIFDNQSNENAMHFLAIRPRLLRVEIMFEENAFLLEKISINFYKSN